MAMASFSFVPVKRKRSRRLCIGYIRYYQESELYYWQKIQDLVNQKRTLFAQKLAKDSKVTLKRPRSMVEEGDEMKKKKKKKKKVPKKKELVRNEVTERLKEFIEEEMKGSELKVVIQKVLYPTDLEKSQNRLSMPLNQLETDEFWTADEKRKLEKGGELEVPLLGPSLQMFGKPMVLKMWHLKTTDNYVLKTNWNKFKEENKVDLKANTIIQVWSFRRDQRLCLALACVQRPNKHRRRLMTRLHPPVDSIV